MIGAKNPLQSMFEGNDGKGQVSGPRGLDALFESGPRYPTEGNAVGAYPTPVAEPRTDYRQAMEKLEALMAEREMQRGGAVQIGEELLRPANG